MTCVIRVARENCKCPVELLGHNQSRKGMSHGKRPQRKQKLGLCSGCRRPTVGWPDCENNILRALVAQRSEPCGKRFRNHLPATAIKQHRNRRGPCLLSAEPVEEGLLGLERFRPAAGEARAAIEIEVRKGIKSIFGIGLGADMSQGDLHRWEDILYCCNAKT